MRRAATNTASLCDTPISVRELSNRAKYPKIAKRVHRLKIGQHFDVRGIGTDERSRNRFRYGLYAAARLDKVSVRAQPDGSVRVTKVGAWSSLLG
jgi:hypothetical protein